MRHIFSKSLAPCIAALVFASCGPAPRPRGPTEDELRIITETEAQELLREALDSAGVPVQTEWQVDIGGGATLEVDMRLAQSDFGIEWVSPQDRQDHGDRLPHPDPSGQLRILPGAGTDAQAQILVLDHRSYRYDPDRERVQRGSTGAAEAEDRVRRDVRDYLEYVRGQGAL